MAKLRQLRLSTSKGAKPNAVDVTNDKAEARDERGSLGCRLSHMVGVQLF